MKHKPTKMWELHAVENNKIKKKAEECPRCGEGVFISTHKEKSGKVRHYCGKCHYTVWP